MQLTKIHKVIVSFLVVLVLFGGYVFFDKTSSNTEEIVLNDVPTATTSIQSGVTTGGLTYTIEPASATQTNTVPKPVPDLDRPIIKSSGANVTEADRVSATANVKMLQTTLKTNPVAFANWMDLAMYQKMGGDYEGALISWKYAGKLRPDDFVSLGNIGNLYAYYIKNNAEAEVYYKQAIAKSPREGYLYLQLAQVYADFFLDKAKAKAIIDQGLSQIPNDTVLIEFKAILNQ